MAELSNFSNEELRKELQQREKEILKSEYEKLEDIRKFFNQPYTTEDKVFLNYTVIFQWLELIYGNDEAKRMMAFVDNGDLFEVRIDFIKKDHSKYMNKNGKFLWET